MTAQNCLSVAIELTFSSSLLFFSVLFFLSLPTRSRKRADRTPISTAPVLVAPTPPAAIVLAETQAIVPLFNCLLSCSSWSLIER